MDRDLCVMRFEISANASRYWATSLCSASHADPALKEMDRLIFVALPPWDYAWKNIPLAASRKVTPEVRIDGRG